MKLTKTRLKQIIREEILSEIEDIKELEHEILTYQTNSEIIEKKKKEIQKIVDDIKQMETSNKKKFKDIQKFMIRFAIDKKKVDIWIAQIQNVLKYKVIRPDYKTLWLEYTKKVNTATKRIMANMKDVQLELKKKETVQTLSIGQNEGIISSLKSLWGKFKSLFINLRNFTKVSNKLPKIK
jgi:hypothetical protein